MKIYGLMLGLIISGTFSTIVLKGLDLHNVRGASFDHPYIQSGLMFLGEMCCLIPWALMGMYKVEERATTIYSLPAVLDLLESTLSNFGLLLTSAGVFQMISGAAVIIVAFLSVTFLGRKLNVEQILGVFLVFTGVTLVGFSSVQSSGSGSMFGVISLMLGLTIQSGQSVLEEHLMIKYDTNPFFLLGCEGSFGLLYLVFILPVLNFITWEHSMCDHGRIENLTLAARQIHSDHHVQLMALVWVISLGVMNFWAITLTKESGAVSKSIIDTLKILFVWMISMMYGWEEFMWTQLIGFVFLVLGNLIYNKGSGDDPPDPDVKYKESV